jgi:hypothetical protein
MAKKLGEKGTKEAKRAGSSPVGSAINHHRPTGHAKGCSPEQPFVFSNGGDGPVVESTYVNAGESNR